MVCYQCFDCSRFFDNTEDILQHCKQFNHEPHSCFYCKTVMSDDLALALHYNIVHDHETSSFLSDSSDSDSPITPVDTSSQLAAPAVVDVQVVKDNESVGNKEQVQFGSDVKEKKNVGGAQPIGPSAAAGVVKVVNRSSSSSRFGCLPCNLTFTTMEKLHNHIFLTHYFFCPKCPNFFFSTPVLLAQHLSAFHLNGGTAPKTCCNVGYSSAVDYVSHLQGKKHTGPRPCPFCDVVCRSRKLLDAHMSSHTFSQFVQECATRLYDLRIITYPDGITKHAKVQSVTKPKSEIPVVTSRSIVTKAPSVKPVPKVQPPLYHCSKDYKTAEELHKHLESDHAWCPVCPKVMFVPRSQSLKDHLKSHWDSKKILNCCGRPIGTSHDLVAHVSGKKHTTGTYCRFCFVDLKSPTQLSLHLQASHKDNQMDSEVRKLYSR